MKDRLFDKVYESAKSRCHLAEFLIGKRPQEVDSANIRPVIFGNKFNDLAFLYDRCIYIMLEEQSTECVNIAYRLLEYVVAGLRQQIDSEKVLYGTTRVMFPVPKLYAVNVGIDERKQAIPDIKSTIRLSDSYMDLPEDLMKVLPDLELVVNTYDFRMQKDEVLQYINAGILPERWKSYSIYKNELLQYAVSVATITYIQRAGRQAASNEKITYQMPEKGKNVTEIIQLLTTRDVLKPYFMRKEVCDLTVAQFSREDIIRVSSKEEGRVEGRKEEKRAMTLRLYKQGVADNIIATAADEEIEVIKSWIKEENMV